VRYRTNLRKSVEILRVHPMPIYWYGPGDKPPPTTAARPGDNSPTIIDTPGQNLFIGMIVYLHGLLWTALSLTSWGHATLHHLWVCILLEERGDSTMWDTGAQSMWNRMNNMVLTVQLCHSFAMQLNLTLELYLGGATACNCSGVRDHEPATRRIQVHARLDCTRTIHLHPRLSRPPCWRYHRW